MKCVYILTIAGIVKTVSELAIVEVPTDVTIIAIVIKTAVVIQTVTVTAMAS